MLTRRLQVLVEPEQYERLERHARTRGTSIGETVRDAIDRVVAPRLGGRKAAVERFLSAEPVEFPLDPAELEAELDGLFDET